MIDNLYSPKQYEVLKFALNNDFFMLINHGAKRSGKTVVDNDIFLFELKRIRKIANKLNIKLPQYILAGADLGALQRNVLSELANKYEIDIKLDKHNRFVLFGVQVCCFGHSKSNDIDHVRGMTAFGAYINEATLANKEVLYEIKSRCSGEGARMILDTNTDSPEHYIKKDFIDKADGKSIKEFNWQLTDNTFLTQRYIDNIIQTTPSGMFTDRAIKGYWVTAEGIVYADYNKDIAEVNSIEGLNFVRYIAGVDWGYSHYGAIVVIGIDDKGNYYLVEEIAKQFEEIDYWVNKAHEVIKKYGYIPFYCDTARPEYIQKFKDNSINALEANKEVLSGIEDVAKLYKSNRLFIYKPKCTRFFEEIYNYVWNKNKDEPVKIFDDVQDGMRYAIHSDNTKKVLKVSNTRFI